MHFISRAAGNPPQSHASFSSEFPWAVLSTTRRTKQPWQLATLQANISPIPFKGVDILSQTCVHGKGKERKETEEDELAKNWHKARDLSLPPNALKGFSF